MNAFQKKPAKPLSISLAMFRQLLHPWISFSGIDLLDEKLNDPNALYNQALRDIQNNTLALYEEMIEYNNKYGSGNPADIFEKWSNADESLDAYYKLMGQAYKNILLVDAYRPSGYASGTSHATPGIHELFEKGDEYVYTTKKLLDVEEVIGKVDTAPRLTYEATYDEEYRFTLWEQEGDDESTRTAKSQFVIQGGGGAGGTTSTLKIEYVTKTPLVVTTNDTAVITYIFSGTDSSGDEVLEGTATWKVGSTVVSTGTIAAGTNSFDITEFLSVGTQKVTLTITDDAGSLVTKKWTVQKIDVRIESTFNDKLANPLGTVSFDYTPYGAVAKTIHFNLDGDEVGNVVTSVSGIPMAFTLPSQKHGAHLLDVYMTADINGNTIESNHIVKDVIWYDENESAPVIGCATQEFTAMQYDTTKHSGQGTSSNEYGYSGRNLDLIMNGSDTEFTFGDGVTTGKTITLTRDSTPTDYLNIKVNVASSDNENNAQLTMRFNEYQPYMRTARLRDPKIRDTMEFYNCVVFVKERNEDISTHREFTDTAYHK